VCREGTSWLADTQRGHPVSQNDDAGTTVVLEVEPACRIFAHIDPEMGSHLKEETAAQCSLTVDPNRSVGPHPPFEECVGSS